MEGISDTIDSISDKSGVSGLGLASRVASQGWPVGAKTKANIGEASLEACGALLIPIRQGWKGVGESGSEIDRARYERHQRGHACAIELGVAGAGYITAERAGSHDRELRKTGLCGGRNRPASGVIGHELLDKCQTGVEAYQEFVAPMHSVEDNLDAQRYECAEGRAGDLPERKFDVSSWRPGRYQMPTTLAITIARAIPTAKLVRQRSRKNASKKAATDPQEMRFRRGGEQTGADRDEECSNEKRADEENRRTSG